MFQVCTSDPESICHLSNPNISSNTATSRASSNSRLGDLFSFPIFHHSLRLPRLVKQWPKSTCSCSALKPAELKPTYQGKHLQRCDRIYWNTLSDIVFDTRGRDLKCSKTPRFTSVIVCEILSSRSRMPQGIVLKVFRRLL